MMIGCCIFMGEIMVDSYNES